MKKIYAVIGGAGFIGHHIVNKLIDTGHKVIVIDNLSTGARENINPNAIFYKLDISQDDITDILKGVHVVILTAALARVQPSIKDPIRFNKTNVEGTLRVLHSCYLAGVQRVVYSASSSAYGNTEIFPTPETARPSPLSPYGLQKYIGEQYCKLYSQIYKLDTVSLRYFNVYGPGMPIAGAYRTALGIFGEQYKKGLPLTFTNDGEQRRDFTHVQDVVSANLLAAEYEHLLNGEVFNVGSGLNYSVNDVIRMFDCDSIFLENCIEPKITLADNSKLRETFSWVPTGDLPKFIEQYKKTLK